MSSNQEVFLRPGLQEGYLSFLPVSPAPRISMLAPLSYTPPILHSQLHMGAPVDTPYQAFSQQPASDAREPLWTSVPVKPSQTAASATIWPHKEPKQEPLSWFWVVLAAQNHWAASQPAWPWEIIINCFKLLSLEDVPDTPTGDQNSGRPDE